MDEIKMECISAHECRFQIQNATLIDEKDRRST